MRGSTIKRILRNWTGVNKSFPGLNIYTRPDNFTLLASRHFIFIQPPVMLLSCRTIEKIRQSEVKLHPCVTTTNQPTNWIQQTTNNA